LNELVEEAAAQLARVPAPENGQVRAVPDERNLRYYTTLGLLDRPTAMRGRTALYGPRHLAQVVAIKRLQSSGKSLAEIQTILSSIDDATLTRLSGVSVPRSERAPTRGAFWRTPTAASAPPPEPAPAPPPRSCLRIPLAPGVELLVDAPHDSVVDLQAVATAASALLSELAAQGLGTND
jgi:DNA-binding transcriptional MerR regulator